MDISVIIVTYNSADCIAACVQSVLAQSDVSFEVIVVDNASTDETLERLKGLDCKVIASPENLGFGRGNNLGFASSSGRYLHFLNPDAVVDGEKSLAKICRQMETHPQWGMAGTLMLSETGEPNPPPSAIYPSQHLVRRDFSKLPGDICWVLGASMVFRRELYEKLGGFDPGFFLYSEETDICLRLRELGFEIGHITEVSVRHIGGASEDLRDPYVVSSRKLKGMLRFREKHYHPEDCLFLAKRDYRRALFRMLSNGFLSLFQPARSKAWQKYRQYRAIWEVSRDHLASGN